MKKLKKVLSIVLTVFVIVCLCFALTSCVESKKVSKNVSQEVDNFNVLRRFAVINTRTDRVEFELIGAFSLEASNSNKISVIVEVENGTYKKHIIGMNENTMYIVEDLGGAKVNKYKYEVNYIPESIIPFTVIQEE